MLPSFLRRHLTPIAGLVLSSIMLTSYAFSASSGPVAPKVSWSPSSVTITFSAGGGPSSAPVGVSFGCSPATPNGVILRAKTNQPSRIALSPIPTSFRTCNPGFPNGVNLIATCLAPSAQCVGKYSGTVTVREPAQYRDLAFPLKVTINVNP